MSLGLETQRIGWDARSEHWGDDVQWVGSIGPVKIRATILPLGTIDPDALLSGDKREHDQMQILRDGCPDIKSGHLIVRGSDKWKVVGRMNSRADFIMLFELQKIVSGLDK